MPGVPKRGAGRLQTAGSALLTPVGSAGDQISLDPRSVSGRVSRGEGLLRSCRPSTASGRPPRPLALPARRDSRESSAPAPRPRSGWDTAPRERGSGSTRDGGCSTLPAGRGGRAERLPCASLGLCGEERALLTGLFFFPETQIS